MAELKLTHDELELLAELLAERLMVQLSRAMTKGNFRGARVKLRRIYHRMDAALRQMDQLDREAKKRR